jgi:hypothetical protein
MGSVERGSAQDLDHTPFDRLLQQHVNDQGLVDYGAFASSSTFDAYLDQLARTDPQQLARADQLALWINAYNAYTIALINRHGERRSIRNINRTLGLLPLTGPWAEPLARVGGRAYTLDHIEHEIVRPEFREPRIHFALVCAAVGCPPLRREAFTADRLDDQLDEQAQHFLLRGPEKNRVDVAGRTVYLSPIFRWYRADFPRDDAEFGRYVARFFPESAERRLLEAGGFRIRYTEYDWSLNIQP